MVAAASAAAAATVAVAVGALTARVAENGTSLGAQVALATIQGVYVAVRQFQHQYAAPILDSAKSDSHGALAGRAAAPDFLQ